jgi:hypothetical protein
MVAAAVVVTLAYLYVLIRDKRVGMRKFLIAQLFMPVGAVLAVWFVMDDDRQRTLPISAGRWT